MMIQPRITGSQEKLVLEAAPHLSKVISKIKPGLSVNSNNTRIFFPLQNGISIGLGIFLYIFFVNFVIVGTSNAVNLTDGLDGLVSVPSIINLICLSLLIYFA
jgi:UDP-N-acetylmuramyl pentapeptide phosphotransferase/UDP-N-acetylglucosamine-1-phosphate transferase